MKKSYIALPQSSHAAMLFEYLIEDTLYQYITDRKYSTTYELEQRIQRLVVGSGRTDETWLNWVIFSDELQSQPVGRLQTTIFPEQKTAQIGYVIFKDYWGLGYATYGVQWMENFLKEFYKIEKIEAYVDPKNIASSKVLEKNQFKLIHKDQDDLYYLKVLSI